MLEYNNWSIEQHDWSQNEEPQIEQQLSFSNDYLCQTAHFEEHYASPQKLYTYIKGVEKPIPNISSISIRLHDERLDLAQWQVLNFYRCLYKNEPRLVRQFKTISPKGYQLQIEAQRTLRLDKKEIMDISYSVLSDNYDGPISLLALLGGGEESVDWYPLMNHVDKNLCWMWLQMKQAGLQLCCAMQYQLLKNGTPITHRPIKIEKQHIVGYSATLPIAKGDTYTLQKQVVVMDSLHHDKEHLIENAIQCLTI